MEVTLEQLNYFKFPLKTLEIAFQRTPLGATAFGGRLSEPLFVKSWIRLSFESEYLFNPITEIFIQSNHEDIYSIQSRKYLFNPITEIFIQSVKYSFNPITEIFIQSNHEDIYSIQSRKYLFNPITEIFIQSVKYSFNPITEIFIQSNHKNDYSISHSYSIHSKTYSMQSSKNSFNLPGASAVSIKYGLRTDGLRTADWV